MNRDVPGVSEPYQRRAAVARSKSKRAAMIGLVALFATVIWWIILCFGAWALGYPVDARWMLPLLTGIYLLLVLGLSMAAIAGRGTAIATQDARRDGLAESARARREVG